MSCTVSPQALHISSVQARVFHVRMSSTSLRIRRGIRRVLRIHSYSSILYSPIHLAQPISVPIPPRGHHSRPISAQNAACGPIICQASPLPNGEAFMMAAAAARGEERESNPDSCPPSGLWRTQAPCMHRHNALPALVPGKQSSDTNGLDRFPEHRR